MTNSKATRRFDANPDGRLSAEMRAAWDEDGFLILDKFKDTQECDGLAAHVQTMLTDFEPGEIASIFNTGDQSHTADDYFQTSGDKIRFFFEPEAFGYDGELRQPKELSINKIGHAMHDLDDAFRGFSRGAKLANLAGDIGFQDPKLLQSMYIFKQPRIGGVVDIHQDSTFLYTEPLSCVGFWFAIEDATLENGAMWAIPGGHKGGLKERFQYQGDTLKMNQLSPIEWNESDGVLLEAPKGTLVLLHGSLPHWSAPNRSNKSRQAYTCHVIDGAATYPETNWLRRTPDLPLTGFNS
jgi:phytanoyl-CoA hydroxylase